MKTLIFIVCILFSSQLINSKEFEKDIFQTLAGDLFITFVGHGTLMMEFDGKVIHVDPVEQYADYSELPKADIILVTHAHGDHLDVDAIEKSKKQSTKVLLSKICMDKYNGGEIMNNGDSKNVAGISIESVPAYNIKHMRSEGNPFHPKGEGNGYVIQFGDLRVYVAGDTENIPEMASLQNIDVAFLPMNFPYTMTTEMVADAAKSFQPKILYPYHFGDTDTNVLLELMKNNTSTEIRIRNLN